MTRAADRRRLADELNGDRDTLAEIYPEGITVAALMDYHGVDHARGRSMFAALESHTGWTRLAHRQGRAVRLWPVARVMGGRVPPLSLSAAEAAILIGWTDSFANSKPPFVLCDSLDTLALLGGRVNDAAFTGHLDGLRAAAAIDAPTEIDGGFITIVRGLDTVNPPTLHEARVLRGEAESEPLKIRGLGRGRGGAGVLNRPEFGTLAGHAASVVPTLIKWLPEGISARGLAYLYGLSPSAARPALQELIDNHGWGECVTRGLERRVWPPATAAPFRPVPMSAIALLSSIAAHTRQKTEWLLDAAAVDSACAALGTDAGGLDYMLRRLVQCDAVKIFTTAEGRIIRRLRGLDTINAERRARALLIAGAES